MLGYGNEDENFVIELTYNYGVSAYKRGNDFQSITITSKNGSIMEKVKEGKFQYLQKQPDSFALTSPCGYTFIVNEPEVVSESDRNENESKTTHYLLLLSIMSYISIQNFFNTGKIPLCYLLFIRLRTYY